MTDQTIPFASRLEAARASVERGMEGASSGPGTPEADALVEEFREWLSAPAGDWVPAERHLRAAASAADDFYGDRRSDGSFGFDDLVEIVLRRRDPDLAVLNDEQLQELVDYGESRSWEGLGPTGFSAWRRWSASAGPKS